MRSGDTVAVAREVQRATLRALGPARRLELAIEMSEQARARLLRRILGDDLFEAAWCDRTPR